MANEHNCGIGQHRFGRNSRGLHLLMVYPFICLAAFLLQIPGAYAQKSQYDLIWLNQKEGTLATWTMSGSNQIATSTLAQDNAPDWKVASYADMDGDGNPDILWQNQTTGNVVYWLMNSGVKITSGILAQNIVPGWRLVGAADINKDGQVDLIWQNKQIGQVVYWLLDSSLQRTGSGTLAQGVDAAWKAVVVTDLNNDGHPDLVWQNQSNGDVVFWLMNVNQMLSSGMLSQGNSPDWQLVGLADVDGDRNLDLIWQNRQNGDVVYWLLDSNFKKSDSGYLSQSVSTDWQIAAVY